MTPRSWDKLPQEVLRRTFEHLRQGLAKKGCHTYHDAKTRATRWHIAFTACQLVCKAWSKEAQRILYMKVYLGKNIARFMQTVTVESPHLAAFVHTVNFSSRIFEASDPASSLERLFFHCRKITSIASDTLQECEQLIWPTLLLDDILLEDLQSASPDEPDTFDSYLFTLVQLKFRKSMDSVFIKLLPPNHQEKHRAQMDQILIEKLSQFSSSTELAISHCSPPTYAYFDSILGNCAESISSLEIETLDMKTWNSQLENVKPNIAIDYVHIKKLIMGEGSLQYLNSKFTNLDQLIVDFSNYEIKLDDDERQKVFWDDLKQFLTAAELTTFHVGLGTTDEKAKAIKCLEYLKGLECEVYDMSITFWDTNSRQTPKKPLGITIMRMADDNSILCHVVFPRKEISNQNRLLIDIRQILNLSCITLNAVDLMDKIYDKLVKTPLKLERLLPFFDMNDQGDIKHLLTKFSGNKAWYMWHHASRHNSCIMNNIVLCNPPPKALATSRSSFAILFMVIESSIISTDILPEIFSRAFFINYLILTANSYLTDDPYTLKVFMPDTEVLKLAINLAPLLKGIPVLKKEEHLIPNSALENSFLLQSFAPDGHYTLKIETESKTRIYNRHGSNSQVVDLKPEDVTRGSQDNFLIWIKLKYLEMFYIERDDSLEKEFSYKEFE